MNHYFNTFSLKTNRRSDLIDITSEVEAAVAKSGIDNGTVIVYCPHTTGGITINENADPDVVHDMLSTLDKLIPQNPSYRHIEGNSDSHVKSSLVGISETVLIRNGKMQLGTWQGLYFCEFDGPRNRRVLLQVSG